MAYGIIRVTLKDPSWAGNVERKDTYKSVVKDHQSILSPQSKILSTVTFEAIYRNVA